MSTAAPIEPALTEGRAVRPAALPAVPTTPAASADPLVGQSAAPGPGAPAGSASVAPPAGWLDRVSDVHWRGLVDRYGPGLVADSLYVGLAFPVSTGVFVALVTALSLGAGLAVLGVGVVILALTLGLAGPVATCYRGALRATGREVREPRMPRRSGTLGMALTDPARWRDVGYLLVHFPVAVATWCVAVTWWAGALGGLTSGIQVIWDPSAVNQWPWVDPAANVAAWMLLGVLFTVSLPVVMRALVDVHVRLADAFA